MSVPSALSEPVTLMLPMDNEEEDRKREKKEKARRRSSFTSRRQSLKTPFKVDSDPVSALKKSQPSPKEGSSKQPQSSGDISTSMLLEKEEKYKLGIERYSAECTAWDDRLRVSEDRLATAVQKASGPEILSSEQMSEEVQRKAKELIGQPPDYGAILHDLYKGADKALSMVEELADFVRLCEKCADKADAVLTGCAERLGEHSIYDVSTPRSLIRHKLDLATPKR